MKNKRKQNIFKKLFSVLIGLGISILSFSAFVALLFSVQKTILFSLLCVSYISIIVFLFLWNKINSRTVYLVLIIPAVCIITAITVIEYQNHVHKIPTISEQDIYLYRYSPSRKNNLLAKLDEESGFKITGNLPVLDGATALYPVYASFVQAVYPEDNYDVLFTPLLQSGTSVAYNNLLEGIADIIFCAGPSETQIMRFNDSGVKLNLVPVGREAFVFFVNNKNPVNGLTIEDIQGIYSGKIKNWKKLNGGNQGIRVFQRPENSGSQTMLEKIMGDVPISKPRMENVLQDMGGIINQVADYRNFPNAIGYSFLFFSTEMVTNDQIKLLAINGVYPSKETIQNGDYPFSDDFYAIYIDSDKKNENTDLFIEWILSRQGQELIQKTGYIPVIYP